MEEETQKMKKSLGRKCPECGSENTKWQSGHSVGAGQPMREPNTFQRYCSDCGCSFNSLMKD